MLFPREGTFQRPVSKTPCETFRVPQSTIPPGRRFGGTRRRPRHLLQKYKCALLYNTNGSRLSATATRFLFPPRKALKCRVNTSKMKTLILEDYASFTNKH